MVEPRYQQAEHKAGSQSAFTQNVGNQEKLKINKRYDDKQREKHQDRQQSWKCRLGRSSCKQNSGEQFDNRITPANGLFAIRTPATQKEPAEQWNGLDRGNGVPTMRTIGPCGLH